MSNMTLNVILPDTDDSAEFKNIITVATRTAVREMLMQPEFGMSFMGECLEEAGVSDPSEVTDYMLTHLDQSICATMKALAADLGLTTPEN